MPSHKNFNWRTILFLGWWLLCCQGSSNIYIQGPVAKVENYSQGAANNIVIGKEPVLHREGDQTSFHNNDFSSQVEPGQSVHSKPDSELNKSKGQQQKQNHHHWPGESLMEKMNQEIQQQFDQSSKQLSNLLSHEAKSCQK